MDTFEQKYWIAEDEKVKNFHKNRRMFCIHEDELYIAAADLPYSHASWFEKEGWITKERDELMEVMTRWIINEEWDIHFYVGYDFRINDKTENIFFAHLNELVEKAKLEINKYIYGGAIKSEPGKPRPAIKNYGKISEYI